MPNRESIPEKKFILIAEDDKFYTNIYWAKLTKEGYDVVVAREGTTVLSIAKDKKPDLILLDLIMPGMNGFETLQALKSEAKLRDVKVIVLSNLAQEEDMAKVMSMGASEYIIKSDISIQEVVDKIKHYLGEA